MKSKLDFLKEQEVHQVYIGGIVYEMVKISQAEIAMEKYTKQKLNIHGVMQAEGSDGVKGAAVASSAVGQNGSVGCLHKRWYEFDDCVVCLDCGLKKD
jgi:hypothetical protein